MKKIISALLAAVILLATVFSLASCESKPEEIADINGKSPAAALDAAFDAINEDRNYTINLDLNLSASVMGINITLLAIDDFFNFKFDGDDSYYTLSYEAREGVSEFGAEALLDGTSDEMWYVDGVCYVSSDGEKIKYAAEENDVSWGAIEEALSEVVNEYESMAKCYTKDGRTYFVIDITDPGKMKLVDGADRESYTVYIADYGMIEEVTIELVLASVGVVRISAAYSYGGVTIELPADADSYVEREN